MPPDKRMKLMSLSGAPGPTEPHRLQPIRGVKKIESLGAPGKGSRKT